MVVQLILLCIFGAAAAAIANSKGRSTVGWFFGGFFLGLIGIIIIACLPNLKEQQAREAKLEADNRLMRERLQQERIKNESFRNYTSQRLDTHDKELGVDTRNHQAHKALTASAGTPPALPGINQEQDTEWYYEVKGSVEGPVNTQTIENLLAQQTLQPNSLIWRDSFDDWKQLCDVPELSKSITS